MKHDQVANHEAHGGYGEKIIISAREYQMSAIF